MKNNYTWALFAAVGLMFLGTLQSFASDYTISFTGSGKATTVGSVEVQNLTQGTTVTVPGGDVLTLSVIVTGIKELATRNGELRISSNSLDGKSSVSFFAKQAGSAQITAYGMDGRKIVGMNKTLQKGDNSFQLSLPSGVFVISVLGNGYSYSSKMVSLTNRQGRAQIAFLDNVEKNASNDLKSTVASVVMDYYPEDILLYKGMSGNYATIVTDMPTASKTTNFEFVECKDASGNYYPVVKIGNQTWMAENMRTTKYRSGATITNVTLAANWILLTSEAWVYLNNDVAYDTRFGKLYNWFAVNDVRNISPLGWHVPTIAEYATLSDYLGTDYAGDMLKEIGETNWGIGNNFATNETGFSARAGAKCNSSGVFNDYSYNYLWTATELATDPTKGTCAFMTANSAILDMTYSTSKRNGFSLRCILD